MPLLPTLLLRRSMRNGEQPSPRQIQMLFQETICPGDAKSTKFLPQPYSQASHCGRSVSTANYWLYSSFSVARKLTRSRISLRDKIYFMSGILEGALIRLVILAFCTNVSGRFPTFSERLLASSSPSTPVILRPLSRSSVTTPYPGAKRLLGSIMASNSSCRESFAATPLIGGPAPPPLSS